MSRQDQRGDWVQELAGQCGASPLDSGGLQLTHSQATLRHVASTYIFYILYTQI